MKKYTILCVFLLLGICLSGCSKKVSTGNSNYEEMSRVEHSYRSDMNSLDAVIEYSTNIVKARLISYEKFDEAILVYTFAVQRDYTNNTPDIIYVYDAYNKD